MFNKKLFVMCLVALCMSAQIYLAGMQTSAAAGASQSSPQGDVRKAGGEKTMVGCVAREGGAFVLKADDGTYEFNTDRDLSPFVGKKVKITGQWEAKGVTTTAPIKASTAGSTETSSEKASSSTTAFVGDLHLHITGDVIGDCNQGK